MFNYKETLQKMRRERASMQAEVEKLEQAIAALAALAGNKISTLAKSGLSAKVTRAGLNVKKSAKKKRKISAEGLRILLELRTGGGPR